MPFVPVCRFCRQTIRSNKKCKTGFIHLTKDERNEGHEATPMWQEEE